MGFLFHLYVGVLSALCSKLRVHVLSVFCRCFVVVLFICLSVFCRCFVGILFFSFVCRRFVGTLSAFCRCFVGVLFFVHLYVGVLSALCSKLRVHVLLVFCRHFVFFICMIHL